LPNRSSTQTVRISSARDEDRLFTTCVADTLFPGAGIATVERSSASGIRCPFPRAQTCLRGRCTSNSGYEAHALTSRAASSRYSTTAEIDAVVAPSGSCVAMCARSNTLGSSRARAICGCKPRSRASCRGPSSCRSSSSTSSHRRRGRLLPAPRDLPPDVPFAAAAAGWPMPRFAAARGPRANADRARRCAGVLWLRRHVRGQECGRLDADARRQDARDPGHRGRGCRPSTPPV